MNWKTLDTEQLLMRRDRQHEATTGANVGAFAVPLGTPLRSPVVAGVAPAAGYAGVPGYQNVDDVLDAYRNAVSDSKR
jgi:hypothetical protein